MKKSALTILVFLAMTSVTFGVSLEWRNDGDSSDTALNVWMLRAYGTGIQTLSWFTIDGGVQQTAAANEWVSSDYLTNPSPGYGTADDTDSYVVFGDLRLGDAEPLGSAPIGATITAETGGPGLGTLNNYSATGGPGGVPTWDSYLLLSAAPSGGDIYHDLIQVVLPDAVDPNTALTVDARIVVSVAGVATGSTVSIGAPPVPRPGDANLTGFTDIDDFSLMLANYNAPGVYGWGDGDFNGSVGGVGEVDIDDFSIMLTQYNLLTPWPAAGSAVPEPSTIVMLFLGALCLVGYRARK